ESIFYSQDVLQPHLSLFTYSTATLNQLSAWDNFYLNYLKSNPNPEVEPLISAREAEALIHQAVDERQVIDEYNGINEVSGIDGKYYTLPDGRILRQYFSPTGVYKYEYADSIPEERIGGVKESGSAALSTILDIIPGISNIKGAIEASVGEDIITGRELSNVERGILVAAIIGGPIVKGALKLGKVAMKQLPKVKNILNPDKVKSFAKDFYDDYIKKGIQAGYSAVNGLVKKIADMPMSFSPSLATTNGMPVMKTIGESMTEAKETVMQMAGKVKEEVSGGGKGNIVNEVKEIDFGKHIIKGENGKKQLISNTMYITDDNYRYTTDGLGRIINVDASELVLKKADRNKYAQANVGGKDRLLDDDGGHLIGAQFHGPGDIDNLVPQNSQINRRGGVWYDMETEWANALKEVPPKKVSVNIEPIYSNNSMRPDSFMVEYEIEGQFPVIREITNKLGG
ncbi:MAG: DNA/RNA non-specific endonuclease, partial [Bacillus sp. (in: firmicutes)]